MFFSPSFLLLLPSYLQFSPMHCANLHFVHPGVRYQRSLAVAFCAPSSQFTDMPWVTLPTGGENKWNDHPQAYPSTPLCPSHLPPFL